MAAAAQRPANLGIPSRRDVTNTRLGLTHAPEVMSNEGGMRYSVKQEGKQAKISVPQPQAEFKRPEPLTRQDLLDAERMVGEGAVYPDVILEIRSSRKES